MYLVLNRQSNPQEVFLVYKKNTKNTKKTKIKGDWWNVWVVAADAIVEPTHV